jgi:hypothetical protein
LKTDLVAAARRTNRRTRWPDALLIDGLLDDARSIPSKRDYLRLLSAENARGAPHRELPHVPRLTAPRVRLRRHRPRVTAAVDAVRNRVPSSGDSASTSRPPSPISADAQALAAALERL